MKIRERNRNNLKETVRDRRRIQKQNEKEFHREEELPGERQRQKKRENRECPCTEQKISIDFSSEKT